MAMSGTELDEARAYRRALGCFATGVCAILAPNGAGATAIIANSFTSVSLRPRLVLWCLDERSDRYAVFAQARDWSINVLHADQAAVSDRFAKPGAGPIEGDDLEKWDETLVLGRALARLACRTHQTTTVGDHLVIVGEVLRYDVQEGGGLGYFRGRYCRVESETAS